MYKSILIILFPLLLISCKSNETEPTAHLATDKWEDFLNTAEVNGFSGSVLIAHQGELFTRGFGFSDKEQQIINTPATVFDIGSITKQFTAGGILKLQEQGKLSLENTLHEYFENVPADKKDITVHQLLTHTAGFPDALGNDYDSISEQDFVALAFETSLITSPGDIHHYSNVGYSLLSLIIERVSGKPYEVYLKEQLFDPAGMKQTGYKLPDWKAEDIAVGYLNERALGKPNEQNWSATGPYLHLKGNGGILSTVSDLYKWHKALLGEEILNKDSKDLYYGEHVKEFDDGDSFYGYGWAIFPTPRNTKLITHNGGNGVFFADFLRYLEEDLTVIMLSNKANRSTERIPMKLAGLSLRPDEEQKTNERSDSTDIDTASDLAIKTFEAIKNGNENEWKTIITTHCSSDFINMAPLETHYSFFSKFKERLTDGKISNLDWDQGEIILEVSTPDKDFNMILAIAEDTNNELKIEGIILD